MPGRSSPAPGRLPLLARMRVGTKLLLLVLLPVSALLAFTILSAADHRRDADRLRDFRAATRVSFLVADAVQALAAERTTTVVDRVRPTPATRTEVASARRRMDAALRLAARQAPGQEQSIDAAGRLDGARRQLQALRVEASTRSLSAEDLAKRYDVVADGLIAVVRGLDAGRPARASGRAADAYVALLQAIEAADRERVNLAGALAAPGDVVPSSPLRWVALEASELDALRQNATGRLTAELDAILFRPAALRVRRVRNRLDKDPTGALGRTSLRQWLTASGARLADLRGLEREAARDLETAGSDDLAAAEANVRRNLAASLAVLVLVTGFALVLRRSITRPLADVSEGARRLSSGELAADVTYAGRDEIGDVAASFRDLRVTAERFAEEIRAMNVAIEENRLQHRADVRRFGGTWARLLGGMNATMAAVSGLQSRRRRAERETADIFDLSLDLLCIAGVDGYFKRVNPAFERTLGYSSEELVSRPILEFIHPDDRGRTQAALETLGRGETIVQFENRYVHRDGTVRWIQWSSRPAPDEHGLIYAAARDVTDSRRAREEQAALRRVATLVAAKTPPPQVFAAVAEEAGRVFGAHVTAVCRYDDDELEILAGWSADGTGIVPPGTRFAIVRDSVAAPVPDAARAGPTGPVAVQPRAIAELMRRPDFRFPVGSPITVDQRPWGLMVIAPGPGVPFPPETEQRLTSFTDLLGLAIANAQSSAELTASRRRIVHTADETRERIERDLHDGAQQRLVQTIITLKLARGLLPDPDGPAGELVSTGLAHAEEAIAEVRELARGIHPAILSDRGLVAALEALAQRSPVPVTLEARDGGGVPERVGITVYYVVSEALANVAKHARARSVHLSLDQGDDRLRLSITDDGVGGADATRGSGLLGLKDRVEAGGGTLHVESRPGEGTRLLVELPLRAPDLAPSG